MFPLKWYRRRHEPNPIIEFSFFVVLFFLLFNLFKKQSQNQVMNLDYSFSRRSSETLLCVGAETIQASDGFIFSVWSLFFAFNSFFLFTVYCAEHYEDCICPTNSWLDYITSYSFWMLVRHSFSFSIVFFSFSFLLKIEKGTMRIKFVVVFMRLNINDIQSLVLFILSASVFRFSFRFRSLF